MNNAPKHPDADILILGGGFAGFSCFKAIDRRERRVNLLTNRNHFLFTPLLPLAATGAVEVRSIVEPIRSYEKNSDEMIVGEAVDLKPSENKVVVRFGDNHVEDIVYRDLVICVGAETATYGIPGVEQYCMFLKEMKDARALREKIIYQFERAAHLQGDARSRALNFVLVGGGPTGIETACEIDDLIEEDLSREFPELMSSVRILIIEAGKQILTVFDQRLVNYATLKLRQKGIVVRTQAPVKEVRENLVVMADGQTSASETIIWAAGNGPNAFVRKAAERLNISLDRQGRIPVNDKMSVGGAFPNIFSIGDCCLGKDDEGHALPATGQVAMRQGEVLGKSLSERTSPSVHIALMGMMASLGSGSAIADLGLFRLKGIIAWWFWKAVYLTKLVSARNKVSVIFDWMRVKCFGRNTSRIDF